MIITLRVVGGLSADCIATISAFRDWIGLDVKAALERADGTPRHAQRLFLQGRPLADGRPLSRALVKAGLGAALDGGEVVELTLVRLDPAWAAVLRQVEEGWVELRDLPSEYQQDREMVLAAVRSSGMQLKDAPDFCGDRDVVLAAVSAAGSALRFAAAPLRADAGVCLAAIGGSELALRSVAEELWQDYAFTLEAVKLYGSALMYASEELRRDPEVVLAAVLSDVTALRYAPPELQHEPRVRAAALEACAALCPRAAELLAMRQSTCRRQRRLRGHWPSEDDLLAAAIACPS
eukprot:SRR837773.3700.p2 GENE.SRR837773.3700~~SRR837773.3700.p2  ORF type:complete len:293 (+),score=86.46 SRR837773.3700:58-936(+)